MDPGRRRQEEKCKESFGTFATETTLAHEDLVGLLQDYQRSVLLHASLDKNRGFYALAEGDACARAIVIGNVRVTVLGIPICSTSKASGTASTYESLLARLPPLFGLLVSYMPTRRPYS